MKTKIPSNLLAFLAGTAALLAVLASTSGCVAVAAGAGAAGAVAYVRGDLDATLGASFERSERAVNAAIEEMKFAKISDRADAFQATVIARTAGDKKIELYLEKLTGDATKLKIRVGTFGEDALQNEILTRIKAHL